MRAILPLALFVRVTQALIFRLPSTTATPGPFTITYQSEASDPAGKMTLWYGHTDGTGGYLIAAENVAHAKSPTPLQVDIPVTAADGLQWQFAAGPVQTFPGNFFASSEIFTIDAAASSAKPTGTHSRIVSPSPSTSALSRSPSSSPVTMATGNTAANPTPSSATVVSSESRQRKSSPSVGLIVGVTFAATAVLALALGLLLFSIRRRRRARRQLKELDIEPAWATAPGSGTDSAFDSAAAIEPYTAVPSAAVVGPGAMVVSGAKAAAERQAYLTNQLAAVQAQLAALTLAGGDDDGGMPPSSTTTGVADSPSPWPATDEGHTDSDAPGALREQNAALHARIGMLEEQLRSQWAQGLSDQPPPGYHDLE